MRLGQLARKLEVKPEAIVAFLSKVHKVEVEDRPNAKIEDEYVDAISAHFESVPVQEVAADTAPQPEAEVIIPEIVEIQEEVIPEVKEEPAAKTTKRPPIQGEEDDIYIVPEEERETIKAPVVKLEGLKVMGKIDLPEPVVRELPQVEVDGVMVDRKPRSSERKSQKPAGPQTNRISRSEVSGRQETAREGDSTSVLKTEKLRQKELQEYERSLKESEKYRKEQQRLHYKQTAPQATKQKPASKKKIEKIEQPTQIDKVDQESRQPENKGNVLVRFIRWWRTP